jgi:dienelactone hydrolase
LFGHDDGVTHIVLFHSVYGLRPAVSAAADMLRAHGHTVVTPDLYAGQTTTTVDDGFALYRGIGQETIMRRAREAIVDVPADAVLAGFSLGGSVASSLLEERPDTSGVLFLHGPACDPETVWAGLPVQMHTADPDEFDSPEEVAAWEEAMIKAGAAIEVFRYPGAGHLYTDPDLPDYDAGAADLTWQRSLEFLASR